MKGLVITLGLLALLAGVARAAPVRYMNVSLQPTLSAEVGKAEIDLAHRAGFNSLRLLPPWTYPWQADVINDAPRFCNIARPAADYQMSVFLDIVPNIPPVTASQIGKRYDKTVSDYLYHFIGRENGCAKGLSEVIVQVANEPNYSRFYPNQDSAAEDYTHLAVRTCNFLDAQQDKADFTAPISCMVGELASSHDPVGFIHQMKAEAVRMGVVGPFFDLFSYHCYGTNGSAFTAPDGVRAALKSDFGYTGPLLCSEYAVPNPTASQYCQVAAMVQDNGLAGLSWFRLMDDPIGAPTGLYYNDTALGQPLDQPVGKVPGLTLMNAAALGGYLSCG